MGGSVAKQGGKTMAAESNIPPPVASASFLGASALFITFCFLFYGDIKLVIIIKCGLHINVMLVKVVCLQGKTYSVCISADAGNLAEITERNIVNPVVSCTVC